MWKLLRNVDQMCDISLFNRYLLSIHTVPATILGAVDIVVNDSCHHKTYILCDCSFKGLFWLQYWRKGRLKEAKMLGNDCGVD